MATKKISELEAITEADDSDVLAIVDVSEGKTNKITKNNLLIGAGHSIEMSLNENYQIVLKLKNTAGTELSTASIDLPNENAITNIEYSNGKLIITKQSGTIIQVDISGLINGLATETALNNLANALKETIGIQTNTYDNTKTYNTGDIVVQNEKIYKANQDNITGTFDSSKWVEISLYEYQKLQDEAIEENYKVITKLQEENEDLKKNQLTYTPEIATSHYLQDSADSRFRKFIPIGRTTQESTTGKNHWNNDKVKTSGIVEKLDTGFKITRNDSTRWGNDLSMSITAGSYKFYGDVKTNASSDRSSFLITYTDDTTRLVAFRLITSHATVDFEKDVKYVRPYIDNDESIGTYYEITDLMILNSTETDTTYEPYTGGEPAPNPNYPYAIKNTGDNVNEFDENILKQYKDDEDEEAYIFDNQNLYNKDLTPNIEFKENTSYAIQYIAKQVSGNPRLQVVYTDNTSESIPSGGIISTNYEKYTIITNGNKTVKQVTGIYSSGVDKAFYIKKNSLKIEQGTVATPYSPYGCGNVNEKIENKNLLAVKDIKKLIANRTAKGTTTTVNDDGSVSLTGTPTQNYRFFTSDDDDKILLPAGTYTISVNNQSIKIKLQIRMINSNTTKDVDSTFTVDEDFYIFNGWFELTKGTTYNETIYLQLEQGTTATDYVAHSEQNLSFPLAQGQKLMQGDYPDDDEKVHHKMGEVVLDGTESIVKKWQGEAENIFEITTPLQNSLRFSEKTANILCKSNEYIGIAYDKSDGHGSIWSLRNNDNNPYLISIVDATTLSDVGCIIIKDKRFTTVADFKASLAEKYANGTPVIVQYLLAEEQTEDFTEEQKTAWEQIKKARTYKNITHISSEDETPANVEVEYVQDTKTYIDNKVTALTNAITSLGGNV